MLLRGLCLVLRFLAVTWSLCWFCYGETCRGSSCAWLVIVLAQVSVLSCTTCREACYVGGCCFWAQSGWIYMCQGYRALPLYRPVSNMFLSCPASIFFFLFFCFAFTFELLFWFLFVCFFFSLCLCCVLSANFQGLDSIFEVVNV